MYRIYEIFGTLGILDLTRTYLVWWKTRTPLRLILPVIATLSYWASLYFLGGLRTDHVTLGLLILTLSYSGPKGENILRYSFPYFLTLIVYDSQRFYSDLLRGPIHVAEPYLFDLRYFGIITPSGVQTPNEWLQQHLHPSLDLLTGFVYLVFFAFFIGVSVYFSFLRYRASTLHLAPVGFFQRAATMPWAFFWLNMLGYSTYYWYPSAPPWYVARYGLGPVQFVSPSSAGCARFDQILGTHFFSEFYGRSADVFGAIPSLHVAYPMLALYFAIQFKSLRTVCFLFYLLMCFSAVYLNHHYILDVLWGSFYALFVGWAVNRFLHLKRSPI